MTATEPRCLTRALVHDAARALAGRDEDLARIYDTFGPPPLWGRRPGFATLVRIILEQQVSLAAARTMFARIERAMGGMTPALVDAFGTSGLRRVGLTTQKARYCHELATRLLSGDLDLPAIARAPDDEGQAALLALPGLGPWSVAVYYMMALRRPDVWPDGDLALARSLQRVKRLRVQPDRERQRRLARPWAPYRSVAARMLWQEYLARQGTLEITTPRRANEPGR